MSKDSLEMPKGGKQSSQSGSLFGVVAVVMVGIAGWLMLSGDKTQELVDSARQQVTEVVSGDTLPVQNLTPESNETEQPEGQTTAATEGNVVEAAVNVIAAPTESVESVDAAAGGGNSTTDSSAVASANSVNSTPSGAGEASGSSPFEAETGAQEDRLNLALAESASSQSLTPEERAAVPVVSGSLAENSAPVEAAFRQDSVVTWDFIQNFADWLVSSYQPGNGGGGHSAATLIGANMRYGNSLSGLRHSGSVPSGARGQVLNYVFTPGMIDALHRLYGEHFIQSMHQAAATPAGANRAPLTRQQEAEMFTVYADWFRQLAASMRGAAATADLNSLVAETLRADQAAVQASGHFAEVMIGFEEARDAGDSKLEEELRQGMVEASRRSEQTMSARTRARTALLDAVKRHAGSRAINDESLVYLAQWLDRRGNISNVAAAANMAAETATRLSEQMAAEAARLRDRQ